MSCAAAGSGGGGCEEGVCKCGVCIAVMNDVVSCSDIAPARRDRFFFVGSFSASSPPIVSKFNRGAADCCEEEEEEDVAVEGFGM